MQEEHNTNYLRELIAKYKDGACTPNEVKALFDNLNHPEADDLLEAELRKEFLEHFPETGDDKNKKQKWAIIFPMKKYAVAASVTIALALGLGLYFYFSEGLPESEPLQVATHETIQAGHSQAVLTISNGKKIILDSAAAGKITILPGTVISLDGQGQLTYEANAAANSAPVAMNTISTPTGGFFKIILPDGSNVWLNSESALTFPSRFTEGQRSVSLKGEGYFEISKNKKQPFIVSLDGGEKIKVLGTSFNVMAYQDEPDKKITLLEGSIGLASGNSFNMLKPGQQAVVSQVGIEIHSHVAVDHEVAWKNGLFDFQNDDLPGILRQISRWYSAEIVYGVASHPGHYTGAIRKSSSITEVLKMLELAGDVSFTIVGKKIIVNEKNNF